MAYVPGNLSLLSAAIGGKERVWEYITSDSLATVLGSGYISDASKKRMQVGDIVRVSSGTLNTQLTTATTTVADGTVSEFASEPVVVMCVVSSISSGAATLKSLPQVLGPTTSSLVGFFGATVTSQPASASQAAVATTAATTTTPWGFTTSTQANAIVTLVNQIRADLVTLGLLKGSA